MIAGRRGGQLSVRGTTCHEQHKAGRGGSALGNGVLVTGSMSNREQEMVPQQEKRLRYRR